MFDRRTTIPKLLHLPERPKAISIWNAFISLQNLLRTFQLHLFFFFHFKIVSRVKRFPWANITCCTLFHPQIKRPRLKFFPMANSNRYFSLFISFLLHIALSWIKCSFCRLFLGMKRFYEEIFLEYYNFDSW